VPSCLIETAARGLDPVRDVGQVPELPTLVEVLRVVPDPHGERGRRYEFCFLLAAAVVAVMCGARSLVAIARWIAGADPDVLERLGLEERSVWTAPADTTLGGALRGVDADALDDALGQWIAQITGPGSALAIDGRAMRGAAKAGAGQPHLLAACDQAGGARCWPSARSATASTRARW
jgi:hypothetical protein